MQLPNRSITVGFIADEICTSSHLTLCTPLVTSASGLVFDLAMSTNLFIKEHICVSRSLVSPAEPPETVSLHALCPQVYSASPPKCAEWQETLQSRQHTRHELREFNCESQLWVIWASPEQGLWILRVPVWKHTLFGCLCHKSPHLSRSSWMNNWREVCG